MFQLSLGSILGGGGISETEVLGFVVMLGDFEFKKEVVRIVVVGGVAEQLHKKSEITSRINTENLKLPISLPTPFWRLLSIQINQCAFALRQHYSKQADNCCCLYVVLYNIN